MLTDVLSMLAPQNRRLFKLNLLSHSANDEFLLEHFSGNEALSKLYEFDLALLSHQSDVSSSPSLAPRPPLRSNWRMGHSVMSTATSTASVLRAATGGMCAMPRF